MKLSIHPVAEGFPLMQGEAFDSFCEAIKRGQEVPILVTKQKQIIDGRNRYRACLRLGIKPLIKIWDGKGSLAELSATLNMQRRHLDASQKAAGAVTIKRHLAIEAKDRQRAGGGAHPAKLPGSIVKGESRDFAAKLCGVSPRYITEAEAVLEHDPKLFEQVRDGALPLAVASRQVRRELKAKDLKAAAATQPAVSDKWEIITGDSLKVLPTLKRRRFRQIVADPPYNIGVDYGNGRKADRLSDKDYLAWCRRWMSECAELLTADGSFWVIINNEYAAEFVVILKSLGLKQRAWIKWYETFGNNCAENFNRTSRHVLYFVKDAGNFIFNRREVMRESERQKKYRDKRAAKGGKIWDDVWEIARLVDNAKERVPGFKNQLPLDLVRPIVLCASDEGDEILDPFNGSGTTGHAAITHGRSYVGIEKQPANAEQSRLRLRAATALSTKTK